MPLSRKHLESQCESVRLLRDTAFTLRDEFQPLFAAQPVLSSIASGQTVSLTAAPRPQSTSYTSQQWLVNMSTRTVAFINEGRMQKGSQPPSDTARTHLPRDRAAKSASALLANVPISTYLVINPPCQQATRSKTGFARLATGTATRRRQK